MGSIHTLDEKSLHNQKEARAFYLHTLTHIRFYNIRVSAHRVARLDIYLILTSSANAQLAYMHALFSPHVIITRRSLGPLTRKLAYTKDKYLCLLDDSTLCLMPSPVPSRSVVLRHSAICSGDTTGNQPARNPA